MPIIQVPQPPWRSPSWVVTCNVCGTASKKNGEDPGLASELARKEGFVTKTIDIADPLHWICLACQNLPNLKSNGSSIKPVFKSN
jgi:hypothetical protein